MRKTIAGMVAAIAVMMTAGAAPAMAWCGTSCSPCAYAAPCAAPVYVAPAPVYSGCYGGCGVRERLPNPVHQYYHVNQGPTYTGPGNYAPRPVYEEDALPVYPRRHYRHHHRHGYGVGVAPRVYGYRAHRHGYRYGAPMRHYGHRQHMLRRYY